MENVMRVIGLFCYGFVAFYGGALTQEYMRHKPRKKIPTDVINIFLYENDKQDKKETEA